MKPPQAPKRARGRPRNAFSDGGTGTVQALDRGLHLMRLVAKEGKATLTELALSAGMPASSAHRLLMTLQQHDLVEFEDATQEWMIGTEAFRVGSAFLRRTNLVETSRETMHRLVDDTGETANLGIAQSGDVVFLSQVECNHPVRAFFRPGTRSNMHASGIGKALLSTLSRDQVTQILQDKGLPEFTATTLTSPSSLFENLDQARLQGWAFDDEERFPGMRCIAAPVYNAHGEAVAGISVSGPSDRFPDEKIAEIGPRVRRAAAEVTERIGGIVPGDEHARTG